MKSKHIIVFLMLSFSLSGCKSFISQTQEVLSSRSEENISLCKKAWDKHLSHRNDEAIKLFEKCIDEGQLSQSSLARTYRNIGISYKGMKQYKKAILYYNKSLELNPEDPWSDYVNRGNAWDLLGQYDKALNDYDKAIASKKICVMDLPENIISKVYSPECGQIFYNRGVSYERQGKTSEAKKDFIQSYKLGLRSDLLFKRFRYHHLFDEVKN